MEAIGVRIRAYEARDVREISQLFYETVHAVNRADYSPEQLHAWAPEVPDPALWHAHMQSRCTLVAEEEGEVVAFAELEEDGHLDRFYCRQDRVGQGVGSRLYGAVEHKAREWKLARIFTEASITARPFFERQGFRTVREQIVTRHGIELINFVMEKTLQPVENRAPHPS
jgi:GNAT superfamily N-acetyltransferase